MAKKNKLIDASDFWLERLAECKARLEAGLRKAKEYNERQGALEEKRIELAQRLIELESETDSLNEEECEKVAKLQTQLARIIREQEAEERKKRPDWETKLRPEIFLAGNAVREVMVPIYHRCVGLIADRLQPFCENRFLAEQKAQETTFIQMMRYWIGIQWGTLSGASEGEAELAIKAINALLGGKGPFTFAGLAGDPEFTEFAPE